MQTNFDLQSTIKLALMLGWQDIKQTYKRSVLGPFWITAGMTVQILAMAIVFSALFKMNPGDYIALLSTGLVIWTLISSSINDGANSLINAEAIIKQISLPLNVHFLRSLWKNIITFIHNFAILPIVILATGTLIGLQSLLFVPGFLLLMLNLYWITVLLAMISARYRDTPPIVNAVLMVLIYVTPVMWSPSGIPSNLAPYILGANPFYHLLQITRLPLLGMAPSYEDWMFCLTLAIVGFSTSLYFSNKFQNKIAFWV